MVSRKRFNSGTSSQATVRRLVGGRIRSLRSSIMKQEALAMELGISQSELSRIERGAVGVSVDTLDAIAVALRVDISYFLDAFNEHPETENEFGELTLREVSYLFSIGEYSEMVDVISRAEGAEYFRDSANYVKLMCWKARAFGRLTRYEESREICESLLEQVESIADKYWKAFLYLVLGIAYNHLERQTDAKNAFLVAEQNIAKDELTELYFQVLYNLGIIYSNEQEWVKSDQFLTRALKIGEKQFNTACLLSATISHNIAISHSDGGPPIEALPFFEDTRQWYEVTNSTMALMELLNNVAVCLDRLGRSDEARSYYTQCAAIARENPGLVRPLLRESLQSEGFEV